MNHFNDDELLEYALETGADQSVRAEIARHVAACPECRARFEELREDMGIIGGIRPIPPVSRIPRMRMRSSLVYSILRAAALVILGIALGFGGSRMIDRQPAVVTPAYTALSPPPDSVSSYVVADATGLPTSFYKHVLEGPK
jgi:anti-sigma factor RsiW